MCNINAMVDNCAIHLDSQQYVESISRYVYHS